MARRSAVHPMLALAVVVVLPALVLFGVWRFAESRMPGPPSPQEIGDVVVPNALGTPILSVRRTPATLARDANRAGFQDDLAPLVEDLGPTDCLAVSVNGEQQAVANETAALHPASTLKVIVAAVALEVLGGDFRYVTEVRGSLDEDGVVQGDLYLIGGGDPVLSSEWWKGPSAYPPINVTPIEDLADALVAAGVRASTGGIVGDAGRYDGEWYPPTWTEEVRFSEGGPVSALLANDGRRSPTEASADPASGAAQVLIDELSERGAIIAGPATAGEAGADAAVLATVESAALADVVTEMLTTSDNTTAEMLVKELGRTRSTPGTRLAGLAVIEDTLDDWGVPTEGISLLDGSGLTPDSTVTCGAMLAVMQIHPELAGMMPVAGEDGGMLAGMFEAPPLGERMVGKTGTLADSGVKGLAGYVPLDDRGNIEYVLILNGPGVAEQDVYLPRWEAMGSAFADYLEAVTPAELAPR